MKRLNSCSVRTLQQSRLTKATAFSIPARGNFQVQGSFADLVHTVNRWQAIKYVEIEQQHICHLHYCGVKPGDAHIDVICCCSCARYQPALAGMFGAQDTSLVLCNWLTVHGQHRNVVQCVHSFLDASIHHLIIMTACLCCSTQSIAFAVRPGQDGIRSGCPCPWTLPCFVLSYMV